MKKIISLFSACILMIGVSACTVWDKPARFHYDNFMPADILPEVVIPQVVHSDLYTSGVTVEDVILYFSEVCLDTEYSDEIQDVVRRWEIPITMKIHGDYTEEDYATIFHFMEQLNSIEGFPGIQETQNANEASLQFYFCTLEEFNERMGSTINNEEADGAAIFWFDGEKRIYEATICCRNDLCSELRKSVILEEIYNMLGPMQDTQLREDSIIYQYSSTATSLSDIDILILRILYHPQMKCGMDYNQCDTLIREIYF